MAQDWTTCDEMLRKAIATSKNHAKLTTWALARFGDHGPQISGCMRDHFPDPVKDRLRKLARKVSHYNDKARSARPYRSHMASVHKRARALVRQLGTGFYGYIG